MVCVRLLRNVTLLLRPLLPPAGLSGTTVQEQTRNALELAEELNRLVITLMPTTTGSSRLLLSAGIHCCTAMVRSMAVELALARHTG